MAFDIAEIIEDAFERAGVRLTEGYDYRTAKRSLRLLTQEWHNRGIRLFLVEERTISLVAADPAYDLATDTIDVIEGAVRLSTGSDLHMERMPFAEYLAIPNKTSTGRPTRYMVRRLKAPTITFWPVPDTAYTFVYFALRAIAEPGAPTAEMGIPDRFVPALVAGLAVKIAEKKNPARVPDLKAAYEEVWAEAVMEDRDRSTFRIRVGGLC